EALLASLAPDMLVECWRGDVAEADCAWEPDDGQQRARIRLCWGLAGATALSAVVSGASAMPVLHAPASSPGMMPVAAAAADANVVMLPAEGPLPTLDDCRQAALITGAAAPPRARPRLAYVSPLPPVPSGIADYSVDI